MARSVSEVQATIESATTDIEAGTRYAYEALYLLKIELTQACGHHRTVNEWAWTRCLDCGLTEITGYFAGLRKAATA